MTGDGWWAGASIASDVVLASWLYLAEDFSCQQGYGGFREAPSAGTGDGGG